MSVDEVIEMKIGEEDINHNALRLIYEVDIWDLAGKEDGNEGFRLMTLGYINGVTELAKVLKEVLEA